MNLIRWAVRLQKPVASESRMINATGRGVATTSTASSLVTCPPIWSAVDKSCVPQAEGADANAVVLDLRPIAIFAHSSSIDVYNTNRG